MATKKELEAQVAALLAAAGNAASTATPGNLTAILSPPYVASLATIPESAWTALRDVVVNVTDNEGRDKTFLNAALSFGEAIPQSICGHAIPLAIAEAQANLVAAAYLATKGDVSKLSEAAQKRVKFSVTQKRSRALSLFLCAAIIPDAIRQGFTGGIVETGKLCTSLKANAFDLAKVMELRKAEADKPKDYGAYIAQVMAGVLNAKGDIDALSAKSKAELVLWCDNHDIKPRHADEHRNVPLAKG